MLAQSQDIKSHEELIIDNDAFHAQLESDNPFLANQDIRVSSTGAEKREKLYACPVDSAPNLNSNALDFLRQNLELSLKRASRFPENPDITNEVASNYLRLGNIKKAKETFERVLAMDKKQFKAMAGLANCYLTQNDLDKALSIYSQIEKEYPDDIRVLSNVSAIHFMKKDLERAHEYLNKARASQPNNTAILNNIALISIAKKDPKTAISTLRKAAFINNDDPIIYNNLGIAFLVQGNLRKAITNLNRAFSLNRTSRDIVNNLANAYQAKEDDEKAIELLEDYLLRHPKEINLRNIIAWSYFKTKSYKNCFKQLKTALENAAPNDKECIAFLFNNIGVVFNYLGHKTEAKKYLYLSIQTDPKNNLLAYCNLIDIHFKFNNLNDAKALIDKASSIYNNNPMIMSYLGLYYSKIEDYKASSELFSHLLKNNPDALLPYVGLSWIEIDINNNLPNALAILEKGLNFAPNDPGMVNNYTYALILSDKLKEARSILDHFSGDYSVQLYATRGLLLIKEGNIEEGKQFYNRAKKLAVDNRNLANLVDQKKHLELAKYYSEIGNTHEAIRLLKKGLTFKTKEKYYKHDILELINKLTVSD